MISSSLLASATDSSVRWDDTVALGALSDSSTMISTSSISMSYCPASAGIPYFAISKSNLLGMAAPRSMGLAGGAIGIAGSIAYI